MSKRTYTDQEKNAAVALFGSDGRSAAAERTGIPASTIQRWAEKAGVRSERTEVNEAAVQAKEAAAALRRAELKERLLEEAHGMIDRLHEPYVDHKGQQATKVEYDRPPAAETRNFVTSLAILVDKLRLEEGQVTDRTENVSRSEFDREVAELSAKVRANAA